MKQLLLFLLLEIKIYIQEVIKIEYISKVLLNSSTWYVHYNFYGRFARAKETRKQNWAMSSPWPAETSLSHHLLFAFVCCLLHYRQDSKRELLFCSSQYRPQFLAQSLHNPATFQYNQRCAFVKKDN